MLEILGVTSIEFFEKNDSKTQRGSVQSNPHFFILFLKTILDIPRISAA